MLTSNFDVDGYELFRADRKKVGKKPGRGCTLNISENINFDEKPELIPQYRESICGVVTFPNKYTIIVANIYRPSNEKINWFEKMVKILDNFNTKLEFIINGDLNCHLLKQQLENHTKHCAHTCESHQLTQLVNKPIRITPTSRVLISAIFTTETYKTA